MRWHEDGAAVQHVEAMSRLKNHRRDARLELASDLRGLPLWLHKCRHPG